MHINPLYRPTSLAINWTGALHFHYQHDMIHNKMPSVAGSTISQHMLHYDQQHDRNKVKVMVHSYYMSMYLSI